MAPHHPDAKGIAVVMLTNGEPFAHGETALQAFHKIEQRLIKRARKIAGGGASPKRGALTYLELERSLAAQIW